MTNALTVSDTALPTMNLNGTRLVTDDSRWRAVLARDPRGDGRFVYAVRSTGVYCRPTCPSRRPQRQSAASFIASHPDESLTLAAIASHVGTSPFHLQRTFSQLLGVSPRAYQDALR